MNLNNAGAYDLPGKNKIAQPSSPRKSNFIRNVDIMRLVVGAQYSDSLESFLAANNCNVGGSGLVS